MSLRHLTSEQLIDLAEGARGDSSAPHLETCGTCRQRLAALRETVRAAAEVTVPEPSPLFWDHLSARVREAVDAEQTTTPGLKRWSWLSARPTWAGALAVAIFAIAVAARIDWTPQAARPGSALTSEAPWPPDTPDDPSLSLVADLMADLDWEEASEAGLTTHVGVDDDALNQLTDSERRELHELLKGELGRPGA